MQLLPLPSVRAESESFAPAGRNSSQATEGHSSFQSLLERIEKEEFGRTDRRRAPDRVRDGDGPRGLAEKEGDESPLVRGDEPGVGLAAETTQATTVVQAEVGRAAGAASVAGADNGSAETAESSTADLAGRALADVAELASVRDVTTSSDLLAVEGEPGLSRAAGAGAHGQQAGHEGELVTTRSGLSGEGGSEASGEISADEDGAELTAVTPQVGRESSRESLRNSQSVSRGDGPRSASDSGSATDLVASRGNSTAQHVAQVGAGTQNAVQHSAEEASIANKGQHSDSVSAALVANEGDFDGPPSSAEGGGEQSVTAAGPGRQTGNPGAGQGDARYGEGRTLADAGSDGAVQSAVPSAGGDGAQGVEVGSLYAPGASESGGDVSGSSGPRPSVVSQLAQPLQELIATMTRERGPAQSEQVSIRLRPEFLGEVLLRVSVDAAGTVQARFIVDNPVVRAMIEQDIGQLQASLDEHGLVLGEASVDAGFSSWADAETGEFPAATPIYTRVRADGPAGKTAADGADGGPHGVVTLEDGTMTIDVRV